MNTRWLSNGLYLFFDSIIHGIEYIRAEYFIRSLRQPVVTIFGGTFAHKDAHFTQQAFTMGKLLAEHKISVLAGGGPGIMEAANCGAASVYHKKNGIATLGIGVKGVDDRYKNPCAAVFIASHFFIRKHLLIRNSLGFIVFPGGIGTMDELFEVLNFLKHNRIPQVPVILIGKDYWQPLLDWFIESALKNGLIKDDYLTFFVITDSVEDALEKILLFVGNRGK